MHDRRSLSFVALLGTSVLLFAGILSPKVMASELSWDGPPECAERDWLSFQVERALGAPLSQVGNLTFDVRVDVSAGSASARLSVVSGTQAGKPNERVAKERVIVAADCPKLVDTLAVAIALTLDDTREPRRPIDPIRPPTAPSSPATVVPPSARAAASDVDAAAAEEADEETNAFRGGALALLVGDVGALPSPALGVAAGAVLGGSFLELRMLGTLFFDQRAHTADGSAAGGELGLAFGTLMACAQPFEGAPTSVTSGLCAGMDVGRMRGAGRGVITARERSVVWLSPRLDAMVAWRVPDTRLRLSASLGVAVPLNRDAFILDDIGTVHRPAAAVGRTGLGIELLF